MSKRIASLALCIIFVLVNIVSCTKDMEVYKSNIKTLKNGPYYLEFKVGIENSEYIGTLTKCGDKYSLYIDNTTLLMSPDNAYVIDHETKEYRNYYSTDLNYTFFDVLLDLRVKETSNFDSEKIITCNNSADKSVQLIYKNDSLVKIQWKFAESQDYAGVEVISLTQDIPKDVLLDIPEGYVFVEDKRD